MKQLLFMIAITALAAFGSVFHPIWAVLLYYFFAVFRPQFLWEWALPSGIRWSVLAVAILAFSMIANANRVFSLSRVNVMTVLMVVFGLLVGASVIFAINPSTASWWAEIHAKIMFVALATSLVISTANHVRWIVVVVLLSVGYIAYVLNSLYFTEGRLDIYHVGYGGLDNNGAALLLATGLPLTYCFAVSRSREWWVKALRWASVPLAALIVHAVLMSYSRGAMLAGLAAVVWLMIQHRPRRQSVFAAVLLTIMVSVLAGPQIRERFVSTRDFQQDASAQTRIASWQAAWAMAWDRPIFGFGVRNSPEYIKQYGEGRIAPTVHNQYLQVAADSGVPAALVYLAVLAVALWRLRRCALRCREAAMSYEDEDAPSAVQLRDMSFIFLGVTASLLTFAVGGLFLSLELLELPWLWFAVAAAAPAVVERLVDDLQRNPPETDVDGDATEDAAMAKRLAA